MFLKREKPLARIDSWQKWQKVWDNAEYAEIRVGLLHHDPGLKGNTERQEWIRFCLKAADSHQNFVSGCNDPVAEKAYHVLCHRVFGLEVRVQPEILDNPETLAALLHFFRLNQRGNFVNVC